MRPVNLALDKYFEFLKNLVQINIIPILIFRVPAPAVPVVPAKIARNLKKVKNPRNPRRVRNPRKVKNLRNPRNPKVPVLAVAAAKKMEPLFPQGNLLMDLLLVDIGNS